MLTLSDLNSFLKLNQAEQDEEKHQLRLLTQESSYKELEKAGLAVKGLHIEDFSWGDHGRIHVQLIKTNPLCKRFHFLRKGAPIVFRIEENKNSANKSTNEGNLEALVQSCKVQNQNFILNVVFNHFDNIEFFNGTLFCTPGVNNTTYEAANKVLRWCHQNQMSENSLLTFFSHEEEDNHWVKGNNGKNNFINTEQEKCLDFFFNNNKTAIIHGPPGTGKTHTITQGLHGLLENNSINALVCAASNSATDLLAIKCHVLGLNVIRVGDPLRVSNNCQHLTLEHKIKQEAQYNVAIKLKKQAAEYKIKALKLKSQRLYKESREMFKESRLLFSEARKLIDTLKTSLLENCQVVASTLSHLFSKTFIHNYDLNKNKYKFDIAIIDEAGQAFSSLALLPFAFANKVILAGDHCQLPPTHKSALGNKKEYAKSLFQLLQEECPDLPKVMLTEQYRMHPTIMDYPSKSLYNGKLKAHPSTLSHSILNKGFENFVFIDTAGALWEEEKTSLGSSTFNIQEADFIFQHVTKLLEANIPAQEIGVITPYSAQRDLIINKFPNNPVQKNKVEVSSVDAFQGREKDCIVISLVRSNEQCDIGFLKEIRRTHVAMTRAKKHLLIIGDSATFGGHPYYKAFLDWVDEFGIYKSVWEFM